MSFTATEKSNYTPMPEGSHPAVCSAIIDIGLQDSFGTLKPQILARFEFPENRSERVVNGVAVNEPMTKWQYYTNSLNKKANLRRDLEGWRGRSFSAEELAGFDVRNVLSHPCQIFIIHDHVDGQVKDKILNISKWMGNGAKLEPELEVISYSKEAGVIEQWDILPEWVQEKIRQATDENATQIPTTVEAEPFEDDAVPFNREAAWQPR